MSEDVQVLQVQSFGVTGTSTPELRNTQLLSSPDGGQFVSAATTSLANLLPVQAALRQSVATRNPFRLDMRLAAITAALLAPTFITRGLAPPSVVVGAHIEFSEWSDENAVITIALFVFSASGAGMDHMAARRALRHIAESFREKDKNAGRQPMADGMSPPYGSFEPSSPMDQPIDEVADDSEWMYNLQHAAAVPSAPASAAVTTSPGAAPLSAAAVSQQETLDVLRRTQRLMAETEEMASDASMVLQKQSEQMSRIDDRMEKSGGKKRLATSKRLACPAAPQRRMMERPARAGKKKLAMDVSGERRRMSRRREEEDMKEEEQVSTRPFDHGEEDLDGASFAESDEEASVQSEVSVDSEAAAEEERRRKKAEEEEAAIDQLFTDLETVVKYLGKMLHLGLASPRACWSIPFVLLRWLLVLVLVTTVFIVIVLPTFFAVLVVRMTKVETSKESFVKRAAIIASETAAKHALRVGRLFLRSLPLAALIIIFPIVMFGAVMPIHYGGDGDDSTRRDVGFGTVIAFTVPIVLLQIQGTVRAIVTFGESEKARDRTKAAAARVVQIGWLRSEEQRKKKQQKGNGAEEDPDEPRAGTRELVGGAVAIGVGMGGVALPAVIMDATPLEFSLDVDLRPPPPPTPPMSCGDTLRNILVFLSMVLEGLQFGTLALRAVPISGDFWVETDLLPVLLLRFPDPSMVMVWVAIAAVAAVVLIIAWRMMYELYRFEQAGGAFGDPGADAEFFHSFVGSLVYGHGNPQNVPPLLCTIVWLLCDALFFTIVTNLGVAMSCFTADEGNPTDSELTCWGPEHRSACAASLIAFGFFVPLSIMVAPILSEANKKSSSGAVSVSKPYVMILNVAKVAATVFVVLVSSRALPTILAALFLSVFAVFVTVGWASRSSLSQPYNAVTSNLSKISIGIGAMLCGIVAVSTFAKESWRTGWQYLFLLVALVIFNAVVPGVAYLKGKASRS